MSAERGAERRRFPRLRSSCSLRVKRVGAAMGPGDGIDAVAVNISGGGLAYTSEEAVQPGEFLAVEMKLPEFPSPIVALGRAAWCEAAAQGHEVGVEFWWVGWGDDTAQRAMSEYIKSELRQREIP